MDEIDQKADLLMSQKIVSIYFGGGTPILFKLSYLQNLLEKIYSIANISKQVEITIEANPEEIRKESTEKLKEIGFNRFSVGVQTLDDLILKKIGRSHTSKDIIQALHLLKEHFIENVSIDLMYDLPDQTLASFEKTLDTVATFDLAHLSLYNLTIEPNTPFFRKKNSLNLPSGDLSFEMHQMAIQKLESFGFKRYEISAFAKKGLYSQHNIGYWIQRPFLGFGPSAFSYMEGKRFRNIAHLNQYTESLFNRCSPVDFEEDLSLDRKIKEAFAIELRLIEGVQMDHFETKWPEAFPMLLPALEKLFKDRFIEQKENTVKLTSKGLLFYDMVASEII